MKSGLIILAALITVSQVWLLAADYYVATSDLNIRVAPDASNSVSYTLKKGEEVEVLSKENNWYKVRYLEKTGYVSSKFLEFNRSISDLRSYPVLEKQSGVTINLLLLRTI